MKFARSYKNTIQGGIVGFLAGDAMGAPLSALEKSEALETVGEVTEYISNFRNPCFYFLKKGQYTSISMLLLASLESMYKSSGFNLEDVRKRLVEMAVRSKKDFFYSRWFGPTFLQAILSGTPSQSESCTCIYGAIPLALLCDDLDEALDLVAKQTRLTHASSVSQASSTFITHFLYYLKQQPSDPKVQIDKTLQYTSAKYKNITPFIQQIESVISGSINSVEDARLRFGTAPKAGQLLPLTLYIFLHHKNSFENAVIAGANSCKQSTTEVQDQFKYVPYFEQLVHSPGGATDCIGALSGCFAGTYNGYSTIPQKFLTELEDHTKVVDITHKLLLD